MAQVDLETREDPEVQWIRFNLADETYGIAARQVNEVIRVGDVTPVPGAAEQILGIVNLRGNVVTVLDMRTLLGIERKPVDENSRIIIAETGGQAVGLLVDSVAEVVYLRASEIDVAPKVGKDEGSRLVKGVHSSEAGLLIMVDIDPLTTTDLGLALGSQ